MKNMGYFVVVLLTVLALSGCVTVEKVMRDRVDQDLSGNRGYVEGKSDQPPVTKSATREYVDVKVEIPTWEELTAPAKRKPVEKSESSVGGNRGYIAETVVKEPQAYESEYTQEPQAAEKETATVAEISAPVLYKVKEGDSLGKIAKKFYKKESKWTLIYEANKDKIKNPQRIKVGAELIIPGVEEAQKESKYIK